MLYPVKSGLEQRACLDLHSTYLTCIRLNEIRVGFKVQYGIYLRVVYMDHNSGAAWIN